jgi:hypothetical protein
LAKQTPSPLAAPWRELLTEGALRRMGRLASLSSAEVIAWIGEGSEAARPLAKNMECELRVFEDVSELEGTLEEEAAGLIVAPQMARAEGLDATLQRLRPFLRYDGTVGIVCRAWLLEQVPSAVRDFFGRQHAGELRTTKETLANLEQQGYEPLTVELLPEDDWVEHYRRLGESLAKMAPEGVRASESLSADSEELALFSAGGRTTTTLGLFVGRRLDPDAGPRWPRRGFSD